MTVLLFVCLLAVGCAQGLSTVSRLEASARKNIDSLLQIMRQQQPDSNKLKTLLLLSGQCITVNRDSALLFCQQALIIVQKTKDVANRNRILRMMVDLYAQTGNHSKALELALYSLKLAKEISDTLNLFWATRSVWRCYTQMLDHHKTLEYTRQVKAIVHSGFFKNGRELKYHALVGYMVASYTAHAGLNNTDSAGYYAKLAYATALAIQDTGMLAITGSNLSDFYRKTGDVEKAIRLDKMVIQWATSARRTDLIGGVYNRLGKIFALRKQFDSAVYYGKLAMQLTKHMKNPIQEQFAASFLSDVYAKQNRFDSAFKYQSISLKLKDSLFSLEKTRETENIAFADRLRSEQVERESQQVKERYKTQMRLYGVAGGLILLSSIAFFVYRLKQIKHETRLKTGFAKKIHQVEMRALRAQMNPHFIFNCLNSINRYIVKSDHKTASDYLAKFAWLIRLILDNSASDTITLDKEIQTLKLYIEMEKLRFDNVFTYSLEVDEDILPDAIAVPSMLLQPYVENAIWHGLLHKEDGQGQLWMRFRQLASGALVAEIEDNGIGRQKARELRSKNAVKKKSYGMQISKDRIYLINELYNVQAAVKVDDLTDVEGHARGTRVMVELPAKLHAG